MSVAAASENYQLRVARRTKEEFAEEQEKIALLEDSLTIRNFFEWQESQWKSIMGHDPRKCYSHEAGFISPIVDGNREKLPAKQKPKRKPLYARRRRDWSCPELC